MMIAILWVDTFPHGLQ